jgi:hypothetical protein
MNVTLDDKEIVKAIAFYLKAKGIEPAVGSLGNFDIEIIAPELDLRPQDEGCTATVRVAEGEPAAVEQPKPPARAVYDLPWDGSNSRLCDWVETIRIALDDQIDGRRFVRGVEHDEAMRVLAYGLYGIESIRISTHYMASVTLGGLTADQFSELMTFVRSRFPQWVKSERES